jgi:hypothetical protein
VPHNPELKKDGRDNTKLTGAGCIVTLLSTAVIFGAALPIVRWRDPVTGQPLPRAVAILCPLLIGAAFHGIASLILRLVGFPVFSKPEKDESIPPKNS